MWIIFIHVPWTPSKADNYILTILSSDRVKCFCVSGFLMSRRSVCSHLCLPSPSVLGAQLLSVQGCGRNGAACVQWVHFSEVNWLRRVSPQPAQDWQRTKSLISRRSMAKWVTKKVKAGVTSVVDPPLLSGVFSSPRYTHLLSLKFQLTHEMRPTGLPDSPLSLLLWPSFPKSFWHKIQRTSAAIQLFWVSLVFWVKRWPTWEL